MSKAWAAGITLILVGCGAREPSSDRAKELDLGGQVDSRALSSDVGAMPSDVGVAPSDVGVAPPDPTRPVYSNGGDCAQSANETFGVAEPNPTGDPIGGGPGYRAVLTTGDVVVETKNQLVQALAAATSGKVIFVRGTATIDLTGSSRIAIPAGVTLASDRGHGSSLGALIKTDEHATCPLFSIGGAGVRVTGLRLRGPDPEIGPSAYYLPESEGIRSTHPDLTVDNCELSAWSHAAVYLLTGGQGFIHHNYIHHNRRSGEGYGVCLNGTERAPSVALVEANLFDVNRHSIAATGTPGTSYEARYNYVGTTANGHAFDMHGGADRGDGTNIAGDWLYIHHNTFELSGTTAIVIRGIPREIARINHNWFYDANLRNAVIQSNAQGNISVCRNVLSRQRTMQGAW